MKIVQILFLFLIFLLLHNLVKEKAYAQTLSFEPTSLGVVVGQKLTVTININTVNQQTSGADAMIVYDPNILSIDSVPTNGGFYTSFAANPITGTNKYLISGFENPGSTELKSGTGVLATIEFSAKANGTSTVSLECVAGSKADSNIIKGSDSSDIIDCDSLITASYTVGPADATPITTGTSDPTGLPRSGSTEVTVIAVGAGILLTVIGLALILL
ncbi:hypothetical protein HY407_01985 [Candidatus Gottesmanbacteria bacterium]|nr:hypothetical protein [Candidatus Gottesmanbacteria bacterium]